LVGPPVHESQFPKQALSSALQLKLLPAPEHEGQLPVQFAGTGIQV
jgi:hypothetical protein